MTAISWFEAYPPRDAALDDVTALLRVLGGRPHLGARRLQPLVVFELWISRDQLRWLVGIEHRIAATLRAQFLAQLPDLVLSPVETPERPRPITAREVRPSSVSHPLRLDTAISITAGLLHIREELRDEEQAIVQWVVGPSHVYARQPTPITPLDLLGFTRPREPDAGDRQAWKQKISEAFLLGVRGRIGAVAADPKRAGSLLRSVLSALSLASTSRTVLRASHQSSQTAEQLIRVVGRRRTWSGMLNAAELAAMLGWLGGGLDLPGGATVFSPPPASLLVSAKRSSKMIAERPLGRSIHPASRGQLVHLPFASYAAHCHVIGPPGVGKSTLLANWIIGEAAAGHSIVVIEPKGDLVTDVLARMPVSRHGDVVVIDPAADGPVVGFNPLAGSLEDAERRADSLLHVFRDLFGTSIGPRSADVLLHALIMAARLPDGTLTDVMPLLTNPAFRRTVIGQIGDPLIIAPWVAWFDGLSEAERTQVVAPIGNKLRVFTSRPSIRRLLGQAEPRFHLATVFQRPTVLLVNLNAGAIGPETSRIIGSLILNQLWEAIQRQTTLPERKRRPVSVVLDEWQTVAAGLDFADVFARARGARVPLTVAHQHLDQLSPNLRTAVLAAARSRVVFQPAEGDSRALARVLGDPVTPEDLERLPAFHAAARVLVDGAPSRSFEVATLPLGEITGSGNALGRASAERFGVHPDELDAAILKRWQGGDAAPDAPIGARRKRS